MQQTSGWVALMVGLGLSLSAVAAPPRSLLDDPSASGWADDLPEFAQAQNANPDASAPTSSPTLETPQRRPGTAIALATAPGLVIRGSGHFYAGRPWVGSILLLTEAGAAFMAYRGALDIFAVMDRTRDKSTVEIIEELGDTGQLSHGIGLVAGGVMLFLTSWLFDLTGSPIAVLEEETKQNSTSATRVRPQIWANGAAISIDRRF